MPPAALQELRLLDGPNLYFPRAAAKLTLDVTGLTEVPAGRLAAVASVLGVSRIRAGYPGSGQRQLAVMRLLRHVVRWIAREAGTSRLAVRTRAGATPDEIVLAYPWRSSGRASALAEGLGALLDDVRDGAEGASLLASAGRAAHRVATAERGRPPSAVRPPVPVVSVTGTNGKTTTTRLLAHLAMTAGRCTAWSSTDGVVVMGETVEAGDYSGPAGAQRVLATPGLQLGVLETARGGILLRGMGVVTNDVSVVTNVSADHLGLMGIDTLDQLAEVKAVVTHVTKPDGWVVLNGDDPRVLAMREGSPARPFVFTLEPASPSLREALNHGGQAITVLDGNVTVLRRGGDPERLLPVVDVPVTLAGLSRHNVANALAATAAALGLGLPRDAVVEGLRTFRPDPAMNAGRMNLYSVPGADGATTVVLDLAHNEAGLEALLEVTRGVVAAGRRVLLALGTPGDRTDEILAALGALAARGADRVVIAHKERYLRGRSREDLEHHLRRGAASVGVHDVPAVGTELEGLQALLALAEPGDVLAVMTHSDRADLDAWLREQGAVPDGPDDVRAKVVTARGLHTSAPDDARLAFEHAYALDRLGREAEAVPLYRRALAAGLHDPHRTRARIQLASSLRVLHRPQEALAELDEVLATTPSSAAAAFRALALRDLGRHDEALQQALTELSTYLAGRDDEGYAAAVAAYASDLTPA